MLGASIPSSRYENELLGEYSDEFYERAREYGSEAVDRATAVARTRRFATRQERWFRRDPRIVWVDLDAGATTDDALGATLNAVAVATDRMGAFRPCA